MQLLSRYRSALAVPGIPRVMAAAFVCRLLAGMVSLALLLAAEDATGSYATAGLVGGAYAVALAFTSPLWGRVADRWGPRRALATSTLLQSASFAVFVLVAAVDAWAGSLVVTAFLAGACTPPTAAVANTVLTRMVSAEQARRTLFALSGLFTESVFILGPLIVAAIVAVFAPILAVAATAVVSSAGTWWLFSAPALRQLDHERPQLASRLAMDGRRGRLRQILVVATAGAFAFGALQVSLVAHADKLGVSAGVFLSVIAVGGVIGSFLYGGLKVPGPLPLQLAISLGLYGLLIPILGFGPGVVVSAVLMFLIGAASGPADAIETVLVGENSAPGAQSEAFAVVIAANWVGFAIGTALAGQLLQHVSFSAGVGSAAVAGLTAAASLVPWALVSLRRSATTVAATPG